MYFNQRQERNATIIALTASLPVLIWGNPETTRRLSFTFIRSSEINRLHNESCGCRKTLVSKRDIDPNKNWNNV